MLTFWCVQCGAQTKKIQEATAIHFKGGFFDLLFCLLVSPRFTHCKKSDKHVLRLCTQCGAHKFGLEKVCSLKTKLLLFSEWWDKEVWKEITKGYTEYKLTFVQQLCVVFWTVVCNVCMCRLWIQNFTRFETSAILSKELKRKYDVWQRTFQHSDHRYLYKFNSEIKKKKQLVIGWLNAFVAVQICSGWNNMVFWWLIRWNIVGWILKFIVNLLGCPKRKKNPGNSRIEHQLLKRNPNWHI